MFFSRFSRHFVESSQKCRKNSVFWAFCATFRKKCEKTVFSLIFLDTLYKVCKKFEKQSLLSFLRDVQPKMWENSVFWCFLEHSVQSFRKVWYAKNSVFELIVWGSAKSVWKQFFSRFSRHFVQSLHIMRKQSFLLFFSYSMFFKKREKTVFFHVIRDTSYEVRKMCEKTAFFELFARSPCKNCQKKVFLFHVFQDTLYKFRKKC